MQRKLWVTLFLLVLVPAFLFAQSGKMRGTVVDAKTKEPLIGANITVEGTNLGASTDVDGAFLIINVPTGTYSVKASYVGYRPLTITNERVNANLTTEVNFELSAEDVQVQAVEIVAERPLVNKNATSSIRIVDQSFFEKLPARGINAAIALQPGVVQIGGSFYVRGSRSDEIAYSIDGANATNVIGGGRGISITAEAVEEVQVMVGGWSAENGGANGGLVRTQLRSGGETWKIGVLGESDEWTSQSKKSLGGYSYGYRDLTATAGGPLLVNNLRVFVSAQNTQFADPSIRFWEGFNFKNIVTAPTRTRLHPSVVRADTVNLAYEGGNIRGGYNNRWTFAGTIGYDMKTTQVRAGGTYSVYDSRNTTAFTNVLLGNKWNTVNEGSDALGTLKLTQFLKSNTFVEANFNYYHTDNLSQDPDFKDNLWLYGDSLANARRGTYLYATSTPYTAYTIALGSPKTGTNELPSFAQPNTPIAGFGKNSTNGMGGRIDFTSQLSKSFEVKVGGEYNSYTYRSFAPAGVRSWALQRQKFLNGELTQAQLDANIRSYGPNSMGYDLYGKEIDGDIIAKDPVRGDVITDLGPMKPSFGAGYVQTKIELRDIVMNVGLRYDYVNSDALDLVNPSNITSNDSLFLATKSNFKKTPSQSFVQPRFGFSFPVTDQTVFHAQFGRFIQQPRLAESFNAPSNFSRILRGQFYYSATIAFGLKPMQSTQYEMGFQQQIADNASFDVTMFYKDITDQLQYIYAIPEAGASNGAFPVYKNGDFSTTKGLEFKFTLRRTQRLQASAAYTLSDAKTTGSSPGTAAGIWGDAPPQGAFVPKYIMPAEFNQAHRGNILLDYRFGKNDGGKVLEQAGLNVLMTFASGQNFTRINSTSQATGDPRQRVPIEEVGASSTPWTFQIDARLDKSVQFGPLTANFYVYVINLLNTQNVTAVFSRSGDGFDDGWLSTTEGRLRAATFGTDEQLFRQMYNAFNQGVNNASLSTPRQIRFGVKLEY